MEFEGLGYFAQYLRISVHLRFFVRAKYCKMNTILSNDWRGKELHVKFGKGHGQIPVSILPLYVSHAQIWYACNLIVSSHPAALHCTRGSGNLLTFQAAGELPS